jgi:hypothetical protein
MLSALPGRTHARSHDSHARGRHTRTRARGRGGRPAGSDATGHGSSVGTQLSRLWAGAAGSSAVVHEAFHTRSTASSSGQRVDAAFFLHVPGMAPSAVPAIPEPLLVEIFGHACAQASRRDRGKLAQVCRASRDVVTASWAKYAEKEWGPLDWAGYFEQVHNQQLADASSSRWDNLLATLEAQLRPRIRRSIKQVRPMHHFTHRTSHIAHRISHITYITYHMPLAAAPH